MKILEAFLFFFSLNQIIEHNSNIIISIIREYTCAMTLR